MTSEGIRTCEMHTGGEPVRIVESGYPPIIGKTILDKRNYAREHLDHLRRMLMLEPRGHDDMYGVLFVEPDVDADLAVLFIHNEGYSTMCGHGTLALAKYAVVKGLVDVTEPETHIRIQCPCGPVDSWVEIVDGRPGRARFHSVGAFAAAMDESRTVADYGSIEFDIGYGGAFYAIAEAAQFGLSVRDSSVADLLTAAVALTETAKESEAIEHPVEADLSGLYGTILTDGKLGLPGDPSSNVCVFADGQVDRSPTGSGVTARLALQRFRDDAAVGDVREFESVLGSLMTGAIVADTDVAGRPAVTVEVSGESHFTGTATFAVEEGDPLPEGFRLR